MSMIKKVLAELDKPAESPDKNHAAFYSHDSHFRKQNKPPKATYLFLAVLVSLLVTSSMLTFVVVQKKKSTTEKRSITKPLNLPAIPKTIINTSDTANHKKNKVDLRTAHRIPLPATHKKQLNTAHHRPKKASKTRLAQALRHDAASTTQQLPVITHDNKSKTTYANKNNTIDTPKKITEVRLLQPSNNTGDNSRDNHTRALVQTSRQVTAKQFSQEPEQQQVAPQASSMSNIIQAEDSTNADKQFEKTMRVINTKSPKKQITFSINQCTSQNLSEEQYLNITDTLIRNGYTKIADGLLSMLNNKFSDSPEVTEAYAKLLYKENHYIQALSTLSRLTPVFFTHPNYYSLMASVYMKLHQPAMAEQIYKHLLENQPNQYSYWLGSAISNQQLNQTQAAINSYQKTLALVPLDSPIAQFSRQQLLQLQ